MLVILLFIILALEYLIKTLLLLSKRQPGVFKNALSRHHWPWAVLPDFSDTSRFFHCPVIHPLNFKASTLNYGKASTISFYICHLPVQKAPNESEASSRPLEVSLINLCHVVHK